MPLFPQGNHLGQEFRRVLQVSVHRDDGVAGGMRQTGTDPALMAEVAREAQIFDPGIERAHPADDLQGAVGTAVLDQHQLEVLACSCHCPHHAFYQLFYIFLFVVYGGYDGYHKCLTPCDGLALSTAWELS